MNETDQLVSLIRPAREEDRFEPRAAARGVIRTT
jgi:hypothetical protein